MTPTEWLVKTQEAWSAAEHGEYIDAVTLYDEADRGGQGVRVPAILNMLRHAPATPGIIDRVKGLVVSIDPTEDSVFGVEADPPAESYDIDGMELSEISQELLTQRLREFTCDGKYHTTNLKYAEPQPHLFVMSTGRCGTMSLFHLLKKTHYVPYHSFLFNTSHISRLEQMCRYIANDYSHAGAEQGWMKTRAAEWMGAALKGRPMASVNHQETIFAPVFAALHPKSKFIYLHRNPRDVFASMYGKNQFHRQLVPTFYKFPWSYQKAELGLPEQIMWYLDFTDCFCRAFGEVMGDRFTEISADRLFEQDAIEIDWLRTFTEIDLPLCEIRGHYGTPINQKTHKAVAVEEALEIYDQM